MWEVNVDYSKIIKPFGETFDPGVNDAGEPEFVMCIEITQDTGILERQDLLEQLRAGGI